MTVAFVAFGCLMNMAVPIAAIAIFPMSANRCHAANPIGDGKSSRL